MVNTEILKSEGFDNGECFNNVINMINELVKERKIKRKDIIEYKTENYKHEGNIWCYKVTITYWYN